MSELVQVKLRCDRVVGFGTLQYEGQVIEVTAEEATRMVKAGQAEAVLETAVRTAMLDRSATTRTGRRELKSSHRKGAL